MHYDFRTDTLRDIPSRSARLFGDRPALALGAGDALSYAELERRVLRAAAGLQARGIAKGDRVAILSENRPEWGIASFAVAAAGAVAVPLLVDFPAAQVANILEHSGAKAVFASARCARKLAGAAGGPAPAAEILPIEALAEDGGDAGNFDPPPLSPEDLAAIVYTSGTTGNSKGVMLTHRNFIADALGCRVIITLDTDDVLLSVLPMAHTYEYTIGFLIPMMSGATVRYLDRPPSASALMPAFAGIRPTIMLSVPLIIEKVVRSSVLPGLRKIPAYKVPFLRPALERIAGAKLKKALGGRMRFFGIGGAPLDAEVERFLLAARFPYAIGYGLTETAPIIAASAVGKTFLKAAGPALPEAEIRIAPAEGAEPGVGEIQVRGPMVGPGYFRDAERTAAAFSGDGWFRTGDLGFFDKRGRLFVKGRLKTMILGASGENIYPEEIESVLNDCPHVQESLVYGDEAGLTALVQLKPEVMEELRACVRGGIAGAEKAAARFGQAVGAVIQAAAGMAAEAGKQAAGFAAGAGRQAGEAIAGAEQVVEKAAAQLLERIKKDANEKLAAFSRIRLVERKDEPFEKTPTQKIKRFLYPAKPAPRQEAPGAPSVPREREGADEKAAAL